MAEQKTRIRARLAELVALPSVSAVDPAFDMSNGPVIDCLAHWFGAAGFALTRQVVAAQPPKWNLIARLGTGEGGLILSGHTDTVPYDAERWTSDPFVLDERNGRWYGLGSADMKCFFPLVLAALEGFDAARLKRPLIVLATADEESSMEGARVLAASGILAATHALIGEPTELVPIHKHKGILVGRISVSGRSGHSSDPALGANALDCMHDIITDLKAWRVEAQRRFVDSAFKVPGPTLNFGRISGGDSPNRICAECELLFDIRLMPGMVIAEIEAEVAAIVARRAQAAGVSAEFKLPMPALPPLATAADAPLLKALTQLSGNPPATVAFATEGPFLNALGCESVIFGPGNIATAHQPDEYVEIDRALVMVEHLRQLIERFCCDE